jgi:penicillin G amidase
MTFLRKFLPLFFFILLTILVVLVVLGYSSLHRLAAEKSGVIALAGLDATVDIRRDEWGIPHIVSRTDHDLYFACGFIAAQDRAWQMELFRRGAAGTLAELFGEKALVLDEWSRTMGLMQLADQILPTLPAETRQSLDAYVNGINACLRQNNKTPLEFALLHEKPQLWKARDCIAIMRLFGWLLSMGWHIDPVMGEVAAVVDPDKMQRLWPELSSPAHMPAGPDLAALQNVRWALRTFLGYEPNGLGSNAWVVAGSRTQNGSPILTNDTHLPFTSPVLYHIQHLSSPNIHAIGAAFPGLPGLALGRNEKIAWGMTNGMVDDFDFYQLKADSADPQRFVCNGQALNFTVREERIAVKNGKEKILQVRSTPWGPLLPGAGNSASGFPPAMQWTGFTVSDELTGFQKILTAANWYDFRNALKYCKTPGENFFYADRQGHIGYQLAASVPQRNFSHPVLPVPDSLPHRNWLADLPFLELPTAADPLSGRIVNANNRMIDDAYPAYLSSYWDPDYRYRQIVARLDSLKRVSTTEMGELQADVYNRHAAWFVPLVLSSLTGYSAPADSPELFAKVMLQGWDYQQTEESIAASIYEMTYLQVFRNTFGDELGEPLLQRFLSMPRVNVAMLDGLIARQDSAWFDDGRTLQVETCKDILATSFFNAVDSLKARYGANIGQWWWGSLHPVAGFHPFSVHPAIGRFFALPEAPMAGGNFTVCNGTFLYSLPFTALVGPCIRQIVDLSGPDYQVVLFTGQSGHPFSRFHDDQNVLWRQGRTITLSLDRSRQIQVTQTLRLVPGAN